MSLKKILFSSAIAISLISAGYAYAGDDAKATSQTNIVVVDTQKILEGSSAFKSLRDAADDQMKNLQKEATKLEETFKKKFDDLEAKKASMKSEDFEKKTQDLSKEFNDSQAKLNDKRAKIETVYNDSMQKIHQSFMEAVKEESDKAKADYTFQKGQLLHVKAEGSDITGKVLDNLNKRLSKVEAKF